MARLRSTSLLPCPEKFSEIPAQALPVAVSMPVMFLSGFMMQFALKGFGQHAIRLEQMPVPGVTGALLPIAPQSAGAWNFAPGARSAVSVMTAIACPILWIFGRAVLGLFTDDPEVIRVGLAYLRVYSVILPVYVMLFAINSFLQTPERPFWTVRISLYRQGFSRLSTAH